MGPYMGSGFGVSKKLKRKKVNLIPLPSSHIPFFLFPTGSLLIAFHFIYILLFLGSFHITVMERPWNEGDFTIDGKGDDWAEIALNYNEDISS